MPSRPGPFLALLAAAALAACSGSKGGGTGVAVVAVDPRAAALCVGDSMTFVAHLIGSSGDTIPGTPVRWSSSAPQVVSVDSVSGVARALAFGTAQITASAGNLRSATPGRLDVPSDLAPELIPDTTILAPGDTFTVGAWLRRLSAGPHPSRVPAIVAQSSAAASLDATGLVTAKTAGTATFSLSACGFTGGGVVRVFTPPDSATGLGYLWLSGRVQVRVTLGTIVHNFVLSTKKPAFQVFGSASANSKQFAYEDTVALGATGAYPLDSLLASEAVKALPCQPPRPFAVYGDQAFFTSLLSMHGGSAAVTTYGPGTTWRAVSGRVTGRMRGFVGATATSLDTLQAIFTFSAPLRDTANACP